MTNKRRLAQVNQLLREVIGEILILESSDPVIAALTVTEVRVSADFNHARVFVMCRIPDEGEESLATIENLDHAAEIVQKQLGPKLCLKRTPRLRFEIDDTAEQAGKIEDLLNQVKEDWQDAERDS